MKSAVEQVSLLLFPLESCFCNLMIFFAFMFFFGENFTTFNVVGLNLYRVARCLVVK